MIALALISVFSCTCIGPRSLGANEPIVGRPSARPRGADPASLRLVVAVTPGVSDAIVRGALNEATAIFGAAAITVEWRLSNSASIASESSAVRVMFGEDRGASGQDLPLGWINFDAAGMPENTVHLSLRNVEQLLDATEAYRNRPTSYRELLEARALGRALAHELGHQLMASKVHSPSGLMKAHRLVDDLFSPSRSAFMLSKDERQRAARALGLTPPAECG